MCDAYKYLVCLVCLVSVLLVRLCPCACVCACVRACVIKRAYTCIQESLHGPVIQRHSLNGRRPARTRLPC